MTMAVLGETDIIIMMIMIISIKCRYLLYVLMQESRAYKMWASSMARHCFSRQAIVLMMRLILLL